MCILNEVYQYLSLNKPQKLNKFLYSKDNT